MPAPCGVVSMSAVLIRRSPFSHLLQVSYQVFGCLQGSLSVDLGRLPTFVDYRVALF